MQSFDTLCYSESIPVTEISYLILNRLHEGFQIHSYKKKIRDL